jgi:hypothetical protein
MDAFDLFRRGTPAYTVVTTTLTIIICLVSAIVVNKLLVMFVNSTKDVLRSIVSTMVGMAMFAVVGAGVTMIYNSSRHPAADPMFPVLVAVAKNAQDFAADFIANNGWASR